MKSWKFSKSFQRIEINGQTYNSVEEMPPDVRKQYEKTLGEVMVDRNGNGVPDIFEGGGERLLTNVSVTTNQKFEVNGRSYDRLEDIPAEFRGQVIDAMPEAFEQGQPSGRTLNYRRAPVVDDSRGGVTLHLSWPMIIFVAAIISALAAWLISR